MLRPLALMKKKRQLNLILRPELKRYFPQSSKNQNKMEAPLFGSLEFGTWNLFGIWCL